MNKTLINFLSLLAGEAVAKVLTFFVIVYLARTLDVAGFGKINFAQAMGSYCLLLVSFGFDIIGIREVSNNKELTNKYVNNIFSFRLVIFVISYTILVLSVFFISKPIDVKMVVLLYGLMTLATAFDLSWVFQAHEKMHLVAIIKITNSALLLGTFLLFVRGPSALLTVAILYPVCAFFGYATGHLLYRKIGLIKLSFDWSFWKYLFNQALPIGLMLIMVTIYYNFNAIFLGILKNEQQVGLYSAAFKLTILGMIPHGIWFQANAPQLAQHPFNRKVLIRFFGFNTIIAFGSALTIFCLAKPLVLLLFGINYTLSINLLQFLCLNIIASSFAGAFASPLSMWGLQKYHLMVTATGAITNVGLNLLLIPAFSIYGAAMATICAEGIVALTALIILIYNFRRRNIISI